MLHSVLYIDDQKLKQQQQQQQQICVTARCRLSGNEAAVMDPQGRVLLETTASALADAAAGATGPAPAATGVYVGVMHMEYIQYMTGSSAFTILAPPTTRLPSPSEGLGVMESWSPSARLPSMLMCTLINWSECWLGRPGGEGGAGCVDRQWHGLSGRSPVLHLRAYRCMDAE